MACLIDQELTFNGGSSDDIPELSYDDSLDYSLFTATVNNVEIPFYEVHWDGDAGYIGFTSGADGDDYISPWAAIYFSNEQNTYMEYAGADGQMFNGEATVYICEKESDGSCPDVPLADSIPEKYADYIDIDGNFVPKSGSGGGDCDFTIATLRIVDKNGAQLAGQIPKQIGSVAFIYQNMLGVTNSVSFVDYKVPLYKGSLLLNLNSTNIISTSGDIELYEVNVYRIFGDATISVESSGAN